jgi:hypothetical protein
MAQGMVALQKAEGQALQQDFSMLCCRIARPFILTQPTYGPAQLSPTQPSRHITKYSLVWAYQVAVVAVSVSCHWHCEVHLAVCVIWLGLAQVPVDAACTQQGATAAPVPRLQHT